MRNIPTPESNSGISRTPNETSTSQQRFGARVEGGDFHLGVQHVKTAKCPNDRRRCQHQHERHTHNERVAEPNKNDSDQI
jgi:hypothetical protein